MTFTITGAGSHAIAAGSGWLELHVTNLGTDYGTGRANPLNYYDVGFIRLSDGTGVWPPQSLDAEHQVLGCPIGTTLIYYALRPGVSVDVTEATGANPFSGPAGSAGATGPAGPAGPSGGAGDLLIYEDQKASGTSGGTFTSGAWQTRTLNTEVADTGSLGTLASNQVTLLAGTYEVYARAPAYIVDRHQCRLQDITNSATLVSGTSVLANGSDHVQNDSELRGLIVLAGTTVLELQHRAQTTSASEGFGFNCGGGFTVAHETYAQLVLRKRS